MEGLPSSYVIPGMRLEDRAAMVPPAAFIISFMLLKAAPKCSIGAFLQCMSANPNYSQSNVDTFILVG